MAAAVWPSRLLLMIGAAAELAARFVAIEGLPAGTDWEIAPDSISHVVERTPTGEYGVWLLATCVARNQSTRSYFSYELRNQQNAIMLSCDSRGVHAARNSDLMYASLAVRPDTGCVVRPSDAPPGTEYIHFKALSLNTEKLRRTTFYCTGTWLQAVQAAGGGLQPSFHEDTTPQKLALNHSFTPVIYPPELTVGSRSLSFVCTVRSEPALDDLQIEASPGDPYSYQYEVLVNCVRMRPAASVDECVTTRTLVSDGSRGTAPVGFTDGATVTCRGRWGATAITSYLNVTNPKTWLFPIAEVAVTQSPDDDGESFLVNITCYAAYVSSVGATVTIRHDSGRQQSFTMTDEESVFTFAFKTNDSRQLSWCSLSDFRGELIYDESSSQDSENVTSVVLLESLGSIESGGALSVACMVSPDQPYVVNFQQMGVAGDCSWQPSTAVEAMRVNSADQARSTYATTRLVADVNDLQAVRCEAVKTRRFQQNIVHLSLGATIPYRDLSERTHVCSLFDQHNPAESTELFNSSTGHLSTGGFSSEKPLAAGERSSPLTIVTVTVACVSWCVGVRHFKC